MRNMIDVAQEALDLSIGICALQSQFSSEDRK
jgi:hypothetical protein